jgi:hypothetical protein
MANLGFLQQAMDPATQQFLSNPQVQAILAHPVIQQFVANPALVQALASPTVQQLLANPAALQLLFNPAAQGVLANPVTSRLLADPMVRQLLTDPASLQLVIDPRTMRLLADPSALPVIRVPVLVHRERVATDTDCDTIFINEQVTTTNTDTGEELRPMTNWKLVVDRSDKVYLDGTENLDKPGDARTEGLAFPFGVKKDVVYPTWVSAARQPLDARFVSTERMDGLEVYVLKIDVIRPSCTRR